MCMFNEAGSIGHDGASASSFERLSKLYPPSLPFTSSSLSPSSSNIAFDSDELTDRTNVDRLTLSTNGGRCISPGIVKSSGKEKIIRMGLTKFDHNVRIKTPYPIPTLPLSTLH